MQPFLSIRNVEARYGRVPVLRGVDLDIGRGQIVALLGANGAGKTTLLRVISGVVRPTTGSVAFDGATISGRPAADIVGLGLSQVPEGREVFPDLSVRENLTMGAYTRRDRAKIAADLDWVCDLFPLLRTHIATPAKLLSGGQQQMLVIARAMMARPKMLLLDEPSLGLSPLMAKEIWRILMRLNAEEGMTILLVEQNVGLALKAAGFAYVLSMGRIVFAGDSAQLSDGQQLQRLFLGTTGSAQRQADPPATLQ